MTTDLEKQFFNTFGIKPIGCNSTEFCTDALKCKKCTYAIYPQITDHKLLELIKICLESLYPYIDDVSLDEFKKDILETLIRYKDLYKHQVQELFKEG